MSNSVEIIDSPDMEFEDSQASPNLSNSGTSTTALTTNNNLNFDPNEGRHPLLQPLILMNIFKHIKLDVDHPDHFSTRYFYYKTFLNCRYVCKAWKDSLMDSDTPLTLSFESHEQIRIFMEMMASNPYSQLPCRQLTLFRGVYGDHAFVIKFMETYGSSLWRINIKGSFIGTTPFLFLPCWCPNLKYLEYSPNKTFGHGMSQNTDYSNSVPTPLKQMWIKPFRKLKNLTITPSFAYPKDETEFIIFLLDRMSALEILTVISIKEQTWNFLSHEFLKRPEIIKHLRILSLTMFPIQIEFMGRMELNLAVLNIDSIGRGVTSGAFSKLLERVSRTLKKLGIRDWNFMTDIYGSNSSNEKYFQIVFPCEMRVLEDINVKCYKNQIYSGPAEVLRLLPSLRFCRFACHDYVENRQGLEFHSKFWKKFLPPLQYSELDTEGFVRVNLTVLEVDWCIKSLSYIKEIASCLPELKKLSVVIKGKLLASFVKELKNSKIEDLSLTYLKPRGGVVNFSSGLTGIPHDQCVELLKGEEYLKTEIVQKNFKVGDSLDDWKELRKLKLKFKATLNAKDARISIELDRVVVWNCLSLLKKLETLAFPNFIIQERSLRRIADCVPLKELNLGNSEVRNEMNKRVGGYYLRSVLSHIKIFGDVGWGFL